MHQQQTPRPLHADVARLGAKAAEAAVEHRDANPAKTAAAEASAKRATDFLTRYELAGRSLLERIQLVLPWCSQSSQVELQRAKKQAAKLIQAAQQAEAAIAGSLKGRGYEPGSCVDDWTPEVAGEVAALATLRDALAIAQGRF